MNLNEKHVSELAYQIWESEGRPHGHAARHWEIASRLAAESASSESFRQSESEIPDIPNADITSQGAAVSTQQQADAKPAAKPARKSRAKTTPQMN